MPKCVISDEQGMVVQTGAGCDVNNEMNIVGALVSARGANVVFSNDSGVRMLTGVSGSALDFPLEISGSAGSQIACGIHLWGTGSVLGTDVGISKTIPAGSCVIYFDSTSNQLKYKFASTFRTITAT